MSLLLLILLTLLYPWLRCRLRRPDLVPFALGVLYTANIFDNPAGGPVFILGVEFHLRLPLELREFRFDLFLVALVKLHIRTAHTDFGFQDNFVFLSKQAGDGVAESPDGGPQTFVLLVLRLPRGRLVPETRLVVSGAATQCPVKTLLERAEEFVVDVGVRQLHKGKQGHGPRGRRRPCGHVVLSHQNGARLSE